jgi:hypothetical protein
MRAFRISPGGAAQPAARPTASMHLLPISPASGARLALACLLGLVALPALAQTITVPRYEEETKVDTPVPLPPFPKTADLLRFPTSWTSNEVYVDIGHLIFGDDETLSYTLLVRGSGGAENYTFESLRCNSGERRVLAYGKRDHTWSVSRNQNWQRVIDTQINRHYFEFYRDVFCSGKSLEAKIDLLNNLRRGGRERGLNPGSE